MYIVIQLFVIRIHNIYEYIKNLFRIINLCFGMVYYFCIRKFSNIQHFVVVLLLNCHLSLSQKRSSVVVFHVVLIWFFGRKCNVGSCLEWMKKCRVEGKGHDFLRTLTLHYFKGNYTFNWAVWKVFCSINRSKYFMSF